VLVTRLSAAEDAATMDVLCVDKTGTITMNRLAVTGVIPLGGASEAQVLLAGALASREANQDPIDLAFLAAARESGALEPAAAVPATLSFKPFDPQTRRTEAVVELAGRRVRVIKGAVRSVAEACGLSGQAAEALEVRAREAGRAGQRTLAVAQGPEGGAAAVIGLVTLHDPPRPEAAQLIGRLRELGVAVKMLTGDALPVATEIGRVVGLAGIRRMADLKQAGAAAEEAGTMLAGADGFAEVYPEDKYIVVRQLQAAGHVTGMTGDGVNDAPALRQAEVGIAVESATDVAKGAASVVLTEPGLTNIVALIEQGRAVYQRVLTWVINKISRTILKAGFVAVAYLATGKFAVSAFGMLLLVFMTDFAKIALATDNVRWSRKPETWDIGRFVGVSAALGVAMVAEALLLLAVGWSTLGLAAADGARSTFSFLTLLAFAIFSILSARERRRFWATRPGNALLAALAADGVAGLVLASVGLPGLQPLPWQTVTGIFAAAAFFCLVVNDTLKIALLARFVPAGAQPTARTA
jgi:magnesium-transporting ATPase (P-type)